MRRVVAALADPFPAVAGQGIEQLRRSGIEVSLGLLADEARQLVAPYLKLVTCGRPWVLAKWAMTLDGKIASRSGASRWISSEMSRAAAHRLRGRMDAILVGAETARRDDPLLTARPAGERTATRIVLDSAATLSSSSQLARTAHNVPVLVAVGSAARAGDIERLRAAGCEVYVCAGADRASRLDDLLCELGRRRMTNILVEGGSQLLGSMFDAGQIDEVHAFVAPRLLGGADAPGPIAGLGADSIASGLRLEGIEIRALGGDLYVQGRVARP